MTLNTTPSYCGRLLTLAMATALTCAFVAYTGLVASPVHAAATTPAAQLRQLVERDVRAGAPGVIVRVDDGSGQVIQIAELPGRAAITSSLRPIGSGWVPTPRRWSPR